MRFDTAARITTVASAFVVLAGCGGGDDLPVGGPFGGVLPQAAIVDGGLLGDGDGVLPVPINSTAPIGGTPTWTQLYNKYLVAGAIGDCADSACHTTMPTPSTAFSWLGSQGFPPSALVVPGSAFGFSWFGGDPSMPPNPIMSASAVQDFTAWAMAGAQNN
jgi:hypothetical protein